MPLTRLTDNSIVSMYEFLKDPVNGLSPADCNQLQNYALLLLNEIIEMREVGHLTITEEELREEFETEYGKAKDGYGQWLDLSKLSNGNYRSMVAHYAWIAFLHGKGFKNPNLANNNFSLGKRNEYLCDIDGWIDIEKRKPEPLERVQCFFKDDQGHELIEMCCPVNKEGEVFKGVKMWKRVKKPIQFTK